MAWTREQECVFRLIRKALLDPQVNIPTDCDWERVFAEVEAQRLSPLLLGALPETAPEAVRARWENVAMAHAAHTMALLYEQEQVTRCLETAHIPYAILKGSAAAVYYPQPDCRTMGDIDVLVSPEWFENALELLTSLGYVRGGSEREGVRHVSLRRNGVELELHRRFSYDALDFERYLLDALPRAERAEINGDSFAMLPRLANGLVLLGHIWEHLNSMLGLRQILDWMMYLNACMDRAFWEEEFCPVARELGLEKLAVTLTRLCERYFGLEQRFLPPDGESDALCERLLRKMLDDGNFGEKRRGSQNTETVTVLMRQQGLFPYLQAAGLRHWEAARRHALLRPFAWLYQAFRLPVLWLRQRRSPDQLRSDMGRARHDAALLQELGIKR